MPYQDKQGRTCGFLNILEKESTTNSKRRYFVLEPRDEMLKYYLDNPNVGFLNLNMFYCIKQGSEKLRTTLVLNLVSRESTYIICSFCHS